MKILIIKLAASGDVLRTTCILQGLKEKYAGVHIAWVTEKYNADLLKHNPYIDAVVADDDMQSIEGTQFDMIINLDEDEKACRIASRFNGKIIGFYLKEGRVVPTPTAKTWFDMSLLGEKPHNDVLKKANTKTYQQLMLDILELNPEQRDIILQLDDESKKRAQVFAERHGIGGGMVVGLNTGAGKRWPLKSWPVAHTAALADRLVTELKATVIVFGGPEERGRNTEILKQCPTRIVDAGCNNSLLDFSALIDLCNVVVASDSLALHVATALKKGVVAFFGVTSAAEIDLYGRGVRLIASEKYLATYVTTANLDIMEQLSVDTVFNAIRGLVE